MIDVWVLAVATTTIVAAVAREWFALRRYLVRRRSVERVVASAAPGSRVVDREADGATLDVVTAPGGSAPAGLPIGSERPAA
ncbi:hypothetical protein GCM10010470_07340 [Saccharopolyspora taberi]|uniref:Uncharacterized protein n=1 Tax=Saccharopolyspora taberi TaxID=60895 RepID=A0ABN3V3N0_9PSEU